METIFLLELNRFHLLNVSGYRLHYPSQICNCCIAVRENGKRELKNGTTGLFSWPAATAFITQLNDVQFLEMLREKTVLEIGCGVGLLGLCCLIFASPKKYIFTDHSMAVLDLVDENLSINSSHVDLRCSE